MKSNHLFALLTASLLTFPFASATVFARMTSPVFFEENLSSRTILNDSMSQEEINQALMQGESTVLFQAGDYTKFGKITLIDLNIVIEGDVTLENMDLEDCTVSGTATGSILTIQDALSLSNTTIDKTHLVLLAASSTTTITQDGAPAEPTAPSSPALYPNQNVSLNPNMTFEQVNKIMATDPKAIHFESGNYHHLATMVFDGEKIVLDGNIEVRELTLNSCTLNATNPGTTLQVTDHLYLNNTTVGSNVSLVEADEQARIYINGQLQENAPAPDESGQWKQLANGKWQYIYSNGTLASNGLVQINGETYGFNSQGIMITGWSQINSQWYYFDASGHMKTGWLNSSGTWYYMNSQGIMQTGWMESDGTRYYLTSSGAMAQSQWLQWEGQWYYLDSSGAMKTGWLLYRGSWYYLLPDGSMAVNTVIDGYPINSQGIWTAN